VEESGGLIPSTIPKCQKCNDTQLIDVIPSDKLPIGSSRVVRFCECREENRRNKLIELIVPKMWRGLRVSDLQPYPAIAEIFPLKRQAALIKKIQADPFQGYSLFGPSGCGKSRMLHCLIQEAIYAGKDVFYSKMGNLIKAIRDNEFGRLPEERWNEILDTEDLKKRNKGNPLHIFIDEIDKIPITDEVYLKILNLVDFIYENQELAVLNVCSNLDTSKFVITWGDALYRRIESVSRIIEIKVGA
jgi:DNA replication protein DnaC